MSTTPELQKDTAATDERGSDQVVEKWLGARRKVTRTELKELVTLARSHGGEVVNVAAFGGGTEPDDWCGTMWFKGPKPKIGGLVDILLDKGWGVEIFPRGIINPMALEVVVRNQFQR